MPSPPVLDQVLSLSSLRQVVVLATGGTIAGLADSPAVASYRAAQLGVDELVAAIPALAGVARQGGLLCEQVAQIDSKDMSWAVWRLLLERLQQHLAQPQVTGVVVTHGTDTLEETAYLLHRVLPAAKPVVLTAAMRPANALDADGPRNLLDAVTLAGRSQLQGVLAVMAGAVWSAGEVRKSHTWKHDAFDAGDAGPLAWLHPSQGLLPVRTWPPKPSEPRWPAALMQREPPWVEVIHSQAAAGPRAVDALVEAGVKGLVIACTGGGTLHIDLEPALRRAQSRGVEVWRSTRVARGGVAASDEDLPGAADVGLRAVGSLTPSQARIELMLSLLSRAA